MTLRALKDAVTTWQQRLRLGHWLVTVAWGTEDGCQDSIIHDPMELTAHMVVRRQADHEVIATVVHELLHLALLPLWDGDSTEPDVTRWPKEIAINVLAERFIAAWG